MTSPDQSQRFLDEHEELKPGQPFRFACHPGVPCFGACCSALDLMLTPYDVLRLRRALHLGSRQFLHDYADTGLMPGLGLPLPTLHMQDTREKRCPFSQTDHACAVYENRPSACRTYPLGRATRPVEGGPEGHGVQEQVFVMREPHCRGFEQATEWNTAAWMEDQGLAVYNAMNDRFMSLADELRGFQEATGRHLGQQQTGMAGLALFQLDEFQRFLSTSGLMDRLDMTPERREAVLAEEEACLTFGFDWLELSLLGNTEHLQPRGHAA